MSSALEAHRKGAILVLGAAFCWSSGGLIARHIEADVWTQAAGRGFFAARSNHAGGVNVALGDGSVRFVSDSVSLATWQALATRAAGDAVGGF